MKKVFAVIITLTMLAGLLAVFAGAANASDALDYNDPSLKYIGYSFDRFYWNGEHVGARAKIDEYLGEDGKIDGEALNAQSCGYYGWVAFDQPVKSLGYILNDKVVLDPAFIDQNEAGIVDTIRSWGGDWATSYPQRFMITVPLEGLSGDVFVCAVAELEDGTIVKLNDNNPQYPDRITSFTVKFPAGAAATELKNKSWDNIYVNGEQKVDGKADEWLASNPISGEIDSLEVRGWAFISTTLNGFAYAIDGGKAVRSADFIQDRTDVQGAIDPTANGFDITIDVSNVGKGEHTIVIYAIDANDELVETGIELPFTQEKEATDPEPENPGTADVAVIAIAAVACIALAGVVVAKKVK